MEMITLYVIALVIGILLAIVSLFFDELFNFDGPLDFSAIVTFIAVFGGVGLVLVKKDLVRSEWIFPSAMAAGLFISVLFYFTYIKPMKRAENSVAFSQKELVGMQGELITPITSNRCGEVLLRISGGYVNQIASSSNGKDILKDAVVIVDRVEDGVLFVTEV